MGNILILLNMVWVNSVLANKTFLQRLQLAASGLQALLCSLSLFFLTFKAIQQLACEPSIIQESVWTPGKTVIESSGHQMITNCAPHRSLLQQTQVLLMQTEMGSLTFEKEKRLRKNSEGNETPFLIVHCTSG